MKKLSIVFSIIALLWGLSSCKESDPIKQGPTKLTLRPESLELSVGATKQLIAEVTPDDQGYKVTYQSDHEQIASVDESGLVKALYVGQATITAKVGELSQKCVVTVTDKAVPVTLEVQKSTIDLHVGETEQLAFEVTPKDTPVTFESNKTDIASVTNDGIVKAIAAGIATVTIKAADQSADVTVNVAPQEPMRNEMPLLRFDLKRKDPEIVEYEQALGRTMEAVNVGTMQYLGYVNRDLNVIPAVMYELYTTQQNIILALSRESLDDCENTKKMLAEIGFTKLEKDTDYDDRPYISGVSDLNNTYEVRMYDQPNDDLGTTLFIEFSAPREIDAEHPIIPTAKDFPSWEVFTTHDSKQIKAFEEQLGLRIYNPAESAEDNDFFDTKKERMNESNFYWVYYMNDPAFAGETPYIWCLLNFVKTKKDLADPKVQEWLKTNGFNTDFQLYPALDNSIEVYNEDKTLVCQLRLGDKGFAEMQISANEEQTGSRTQRVRWHAPLHGSRALPIGGYYSTH